ncbi:unnamed protein product [Ectocarpus sp. CCAP 1310/34]|nr:unnamed protein product [Ectocarpus sp. CCAP 1310/34]
MLAVRAGAEEVYGAELYEPLAQIAREVTTLNCGDRIKVVAKRSTDLSVGENGDLPRRADMCINEIYDSALLGEGCLPAFRHALANLLVSGAEVHGVLLSSKFLRSRHDLSTAEFSEGVPVARNPRAAACRGGRRALPLQGAELEDAGTMGWCNSILPTPSTVISSDHSPSLSLFLRPGAENWQDHWTPSYFPICNRVEVRAGDLVRMKVTHSELNIMFEVLAVEREPEQQQQQQQQEKGEKTAATEGTNEVADVPTKAATLKRDRSPGTAEEGPSRTLATTNGTKATRDGDANGYRMEREWDPEPCGCGWHVLCNPERIGMLTDEHRREAYRLAVAELLRGLPGGPGTVLDIGDGATCAFLAVGAGAGAAVSYEPAEWSHLLVGQVARNNDLEQMHLLEAADEWPFLREVIGKGGDADGEEEAAGEGQQEHLLCDALVGEPFYYRMQSLVLYEAMNFWYLRRVFDPALKPDARVLPMRAIVCVAGVELPDLSLSHGPVGSVLGFDHAPYDERVRPRWHELLYPYPLRAYKHRLLTDAEDLLSFEYTSLPTDVESTVTISPSSPGTVHAVAIWVDYQLNETSRWSTYGGLFRGGGGDGNAARRGGVHEKQMLRFLSKPLDVNGGDASASAASVLTVSGRFDVEGGCMNFEVVEP